MYAYMNKKNIGLGSSCNIAHKKRKKKSDFTLKSLKCPAI